jgi:ferrous iron transport protein B
MSKRLNVALIGNPNTGKSSVFNDLTGLNQKVGNYPGITVEKKEGYCTLDRMTKAHLIDLPGTYSVNASSIDESIVLELLMNKNNRDYPDVAVVITDVENLKRNLLLFTQVKDLNIPAILAINMSDRMIRKGIKIDIDLLEKKLDTKVALISVRENKGFETLKELLINYRRLSKSNFLDLKNIDKEYFKNLQKVFPNEQLYKLWLVITQDTNFGDIDRNEIKNFNGFSTYSDQIIKRLQQRETIKRYQIINSILKSTYSVNINNATDLRSRIDRVLIHKFWGYVIFFFLLLLNIFFSLLVRERLNISFLILGGKFGKFGLLA